MICSAECRFLAMFSCLPKCVYSAILSHKEWTSFWGAGQYVKTTIAELDEAFFNLQYSAEAILEDVTPEMKTLADSHSEFKAGIANVNNQNRRMIEADWRNARLLDQPSTLSEYPVVR